MEDEDFLAAVEADNANVPEADETVEPVETVVTPEPETEPAPVAEIEPVVQEQVQPAPQHVPLAAMLDERDKRKALEAELAQFRAQQAQQQPEPAPDMFEDPDGYRNYQDQKVAQTAYQMNLRWSERIASIQHGEETVSQAKQWGYDRCNSDPYFNAKVASSEDPVGFVVSEWKREQIASSVTPDDFEQFKAWKAAQAQIQPTPPQVPRAIPPRSLASAPSAGGIMTEVQQTDEEIFAETFSKE